LLVDILFSLFNFWCCCYMWLLVSDSASCWL